jgi:cysteine desulfuration protein SufE
MSIDDIYEAFELIEDWEERYRYLIDLGRGLEPLSEEDKREENRVHGCTSRVWMVTDVSGEPPVLTIKADSDAFIVKGLIALLLEVYSGKRLEEISAIDIRDIMAKLGLEKHLSPMRTNGLYSMVQEIQRRAAEAMAAG